MSKSTEFYQSLLTDIDGIFDELGTQFIVESDGVFDPDTLTKSQGINRTVDGIIIDNTTELTIDGVDLSFWENKKILIGKSNSNFQTNEKVNIDGEWFPLNKMSIIKPADVILLYIVDLTR